MAALEVLPETDVIRAARNLAAPAAGEVQIGQLRSDEARRLWALAEKMEGTRATLLTRAAYQADSDDEKKVLGLDAARTDNLATLTRHTFWIHAYDELGPTAHQEFGKLALRSDWVVVRKQEINPLAEMIKHRLENPDE